MILRLLRSVLLIAFLSWLGHGALLYVFQADYVYLPDAYVGAVPELPYREVSIASSDGVVLSGWFIPGVSADRAALYLHGNAGNMDCCLDLYRYINRGGLSVLALDYRGYGGSTGEVSEQGTYDDAAAAWQWLLDEGFVDVVLVGHSLGAAVAAELAVSREPAGLVMLAPFTSIVDMGRLTYPWLPVGLLAEIHYPNDRYLLDYSGPLLVMHGVGDETVPYDMGQRLHELAVSECKALVTLSVGDHNSAFFDGEPEFMAPFLRFLRNVAPDAPCESFLPLP